MSNTSFAGPSDHPRQPARLLSRGEIALAVLAVVGRDTADSYDDVDDHPGSLDLAAAELKRVARRKSP
jgi:hypothetical protein